MSLVQGDRIGPYEVVAPIGAGGMGEVLRARDTRLGREVALKVLPAAFAQDADRVARFRREAQILASLNHPSVAALHGLEESEGRIALVMELVDGEDLAERLKRGPIPADEVAEIARQIAEALEEAHEKGIVHRDLKPANVKVTADGRVKVLDFGLARAFTGVDAASGSGVQDLSQSPTLATAAGTQAGVILGTAAYMSPEQARGKPVDRRADIWSFGVVVYEMLTGQRLFAGETVSDVLAAVLTKEPELAAVPPGWRRMVARCLEKDPRKRLRHAGDAWLLQDEAPAASDAGVRPSSRSAGAWAVVAALAAALGTWVATTAGTRAPARLPVAFLEPPAEGTSFVGAPQLSPDGRSLAWVARDATGRTRLWTRDLGTSSPRAIEGTEGAAAPPGPVWSPDGSQIAFVAAGQLRRVAATGGAVSLIVAEEPPAAVWLKDGDLLLGVTGQGLARVAASGGSLRRVEGFSDDEELRKVLSHDLHVSPDGQLVLVSQFGGRTGIYVARVDGSERRLLYPGAQSGAAFVGPDLIVRQEGTGLLAQRFDAKTLALEGESFPVAQNVADTDFAGSGGGGLSYIVGARRLLRLAWFDRTGKPGGIVGGDGEYEEVQVSRRGRWLGFSRRDPADGNVDVWLQPLAGGAPSRLTSDPDIDHLFAISHDERDIAWEGHGRGSLNVMRRPADASSPARLVRPWGKAGGTVDWTPDGRFILYNSGEFSGRSHLLAVPADGDGEPVQLTEEDVGGGEGQFSPDGRHLAFTARATGGDEIYVQRLDGLKRVDGPVRVSTSGGQWPQWRQDGAELYFFDAGALMAADFRGDGEAPVVGPPRRLFAIPGAPPQAATYRPYSATPDGRRFVAIVAASDVVPSPATVILDWRSSVSRTP
ncbi:MAG: serine/threonine-protein kinase [Vicinamibacteria bacterium]|nr:serine/threonine-protein kinase [Vicinamibacteria bacterium]